MHSSFTMEKEARSGTAHPEEVDLELLTFSIGIVTTELPEDEM